MKVIEKDFVVGGSKLGTYMAYTDVEDILSTINPGDRVLPAPFFYEKNLWFHLIRQWAPGENKFFPNGGFEVRDGGAGVRNYDLDQVILHPHLIKHKKTMDKMMRRAEKEAAKRDRQLKKGSKPPKEKSPNATGKRGRPAIDPEVKAAREVEKVLRTQRSGGRRGRPASGESKVQTVKVTSGKRGRPALSTAQVAAATAAKAATRSRSGGKRGRPSSKRG
jgi:hypothetical protein